MVIQTNSRQLAFAARLCRLLPPALSGRLSNWLYPRAVAKRQAAAFCARSSLADITLSVTTPDIISTAFALRGFRDWRHVVIANTLCGKGDTILELGANIGTETFHLSRRVGDTGHVVAFEPLPRNCAHLRAMIEQNRASNITLYEAALSDASGTLPFRPPAAHAWNTGLGQLVADASRDPTCIQVQSYVLDDLLRQERFAPPRLIVMDVEGAELSVLKGCEVLLQQTGPHIILEVNPPLLQKRGLTPSDISRLLEHVNYRCWRISAWGLEPIGLAQPAAADWLCIRNTRERGPTRLIRRIRRNIVLAALLPLIPRINPAVVT